MRKHLLWYSKGWNVGKVFREKVSKVDTISEARSMIDQFVVDTHSLVDQSKRFDGMYRGIKNFSTELSSVDVSKKTETLTLENNRDKRTWDPKWEMDRQLDRGVRDDHLQG